MSWPCPVPEFLWRDGWSPCVRCGRLAWDHEQADPAQDLRNHIEMVRHDRRPSDYPPTMRKADPRPEQD